MPVKEVTQEMLEELAKEVFKNEPYPKYLGDGLYQVSENCITGERGMNAIIEGLPYSQ